MVLSLQLAGRLAFRRVDELPLAAHPLDLLRRRPDCAAAGAGTALAMASKGVAYSLQGVADSRGWLCDS
jgi:hypothetical protein